MRSAAAGGPISEAGRDRQLDALRAIAVSLVLYAHFFATDGSNWGHVGVRLFFVLSGFLITRLLLDARAAADFQAADALKAFYMRRALRIFPPYFAVLGFVWLLDLEQSRGALIWHALYLSNYWYALRDAWTPWVLCHTWSLSIEEQFYLVWPLVMLFAPRHQIVRICIGVIAFSVAYRFYWPFTGTPSLARDLLPPASMDALAAGALLAACRARASMDALAAGAPLAACRARGAEWPQWMRLGWMPLAGAFLALQFFGSAFSTPTQAWAAWIAVETLPLIPLVMLVGSCSQGLGGHAGRLAELAPLTALGRISYGVYLFHPIVLSLVVKAQPWIPVDVSSQGAGRLVVAGTATLVVASASWLLVEQRINALKRHFPYVVARQRNAASTKGRGAPAWSGHAQDPAACLHDPVDRRKALPDLT